jgi:hypothetical protein
MPDFAIVPMLSVHPDRINLYSLVEYPHGKPRRHERFDIRTVSNAHAGLVSSSARRKVSKAIEYLLFMARDKKLPDTYHGRNYKFKLSFITLTLPSPQVHTDAEIKHSCLNQFFIEAHKKWNLSNYLWRAEKQRNGNIHFHVLCDKFIPWSELRDVWNRITNKLGYVDRYRDQMHRFHSGGLTVRRDLLKTWEYKAQIRAYQAGKANDWSSPNSTDIHSLRQVANVKKYVCKYVTKDEQTEGLTGRLWGCNYELSDITGARVVADSSIKDEVLQVLQNFHPHTYQAEYFTVINFDCRRLQEAGCNQLWNLLSAYFIDHFHFNLQTAF